MSNLIREKCQAKTAKDKPCARWARYSGLCLQHAEKYGTKPLTQKQRSAALNDGELPSCVGNPQQQCTSGLVNVLIKGYDDKLRCTHCNSIHIELVFEEAGNSAPLASEARPNPAHQTHIVDGHVQQQRDILLRHAPKGGWKRNPLTRGVPMEPITPEDMAQHGITAPVEGETSDERKERILDKYLSRAKRK